MRSEHLVESQTSLIELTNEQATALLRAGKSLASSKVWWGDSENKEIDRNIIRCEPRSDGKWSVRINDAVGLISIGRLQLIVKPKIPQSHLLYLFESSGHIPRMEDEIGKIADGPSLFLLIATWFVRAAEKVLRRDLLRDYSEIRQFLGSKRGRIIPITSARAYYTGRIGLDCVFDDFNINTPINRLLKAAARSVSNSTGLPRDLRKKAHILHSRLTNVGDLEETDFKVKLDRRSQYYFEAIQLAKHILASQGRIFQTGDHVARTFLIRTPEMVEKGLREILKKRLSTVWQVAKQGVKVEGGISFTPDLFFVNGDAIADIKYKILTSNWIRSDLYQIISFGTAFDARLSFVIGFKLTDSAVAPMSLKVGNQRITSFAWEANSEVDPENSALVLANEIHSWLQKHNVFNAEMVG